MDTISYTKVREKLAETMQKVCDNHDSVIITRRDAKPVVLMSLDDYNAIQETAYLFKSPANAERLMRSIQEAESGIVTAHALLEVEDDNKKCSKA